MPATAQAKCEGFSIPQSPAPLDLNQQFGMLSKHISDNLNTCRDRMVPKLPATDRLPAHSDKPRKLDLAEPN